MIRLCQRVVALLTVVALLLATLPGDHACALAAQAEASDSDPHACCKGADGELDLARIAAMASESPVDATDPDAPAASDAGDCGGDCCASWLTGPAPGAPELAPSLVLPLVAPAAALPPSPRLHTEQVRVHGARGPPPDPGRLRLHARHCVFLN